MLAVAMEEDVEGRLIRLDTEVGHIGVAQGELKAELAAFRKEVRDEFKACHGEISEHRKEVRDEFAVVKADIANLRVEMVKMKVWTMGLQAAMLGLMAHGFHWI